MTQVITTADELRARMSGDHRPVLLDVRWQLGDPDGHAHYRQAHIPGALYVDLEDDLSGPVTPGSGRHPLPAPEEFEATARSWGVDPDSSVVVYDDNGNLAAARAWWLLRWAGHRDVTLLDGGLRAWRESGAPLASGDETATAIGTFVIAPARLPVAEIDDVAAAQGIVLDARAGERYRGEVEPIDPRAGHIPGAISAPTSYNLADTGRFRTAEELRARFESVGVAEGRPTTVYCGSGVTAAHEIAALAIAGFDATLYAGSWSQWSSDSTRPLATGAE